MSFILTSDGASVSPYRIYKFLSVMYHNRVVGDSRLELVIRYIGYACAVLQAYFLYKAVRICLRLWNYRKYFCEQKSLQISILPLVMLQFFSSILGWYLFSLLLPFAYLSVGVIAGARRKEMIAFRIVIAYAAINILGIVGLKYLYVEAYPEYILILALARLSVAVISFQLVIDLTEKSLLGNQFVNTKGGPQVRQ
jgi:hypothetical protein